jgi:hypothetical protein
MNTKNPRKQRRSRRYPLAEKVKTIGFLSHSSCLSNKNRNCFSMQRSFINDVTNLKSLCLDLISLCLDLCVRLHFLLLALASTQIILL